MTVQYELRGIRDYASDLRSHAQELLTLADDIERAANDAEAEYDTEVERLEELNS